MPIVSQEGVIRRRVLDSRLISPAEFRRAGRILAPRAKAFSSSKHAHGLTRSNVRHGTARAVGGLWIANRSTLLKLMINPELYFGEAYSDGAIEVEGDLVKLTEAAYVCRRKPMRRYSGWLNRVTRWIGRGRRNTLSSARDNIRHHYDLGNEFYSLWLDQQMSHVLTAVAQRAPERVSWEHLAERKGITIISRECSATLSLTCIKGCRRGS